MQYLQGCRGTVSVGEPDSSAQRNVPGSIILEALSDNSFPRPPPCLWQGAADYKRSAHSARPDMYVYTYMCNLGTAFRLERNCSVPFHTASGRARSGPVRSGPVLSCPVQSGPNQLNRTRPFPSKQQPISSVRPNPPGSCSVWCGPIQAGLV